MEYDIFIVYKDDRQLSVPVKEEEIAKFFEAISNGHVYRHPNSGAGFWTNIVDIRYMTVLERKKDGEEESKEKKDE